MTTLSACPPSAVMMPPRLRFFWNDSRLDVSYDPPRYHGPPIRPVFDRCLNALAALGYSNQPDPVEVAAGRRSLWEDCRWGDCQSLQFVAECHDTVFSLEFFQDVVRENPNGGRYDFRKLERMPFLLRMRFRQARRALDQLLTGAAIGAVDRTRPAVSGPELVRRLIMKSGHFRGGDPLVDWRPAAHNDSAMFDRNGQALQPGDRKCAWVCGRLVQGLIYYNLNQSWYLCVPDGGVHQSSAWELFDWRPGMPRRRPLTTEQLHACWTHEMETAASRLDYERAIKLRDMIRQYQETAHQPLDENS